MSTANLKPVSYRPLTQRSLWNQIWTVLLQPGLFFRTLPSMETSRQWLWMGLLILLLVGISAARRDALLNAPADETGGLADPGMVDPRQGMVSGGGMEVPMDGGMPPGGAPAATEAETGSGLDPTVGLIAASSVLLWWGVLTILLCEVTLLNGKTPHLGQNFQVAIWSSVPLGVMAVLQLTFFATGGKAGAEGISGVLPEWSGFGDLSETAQLVLLSLTSRLTIFWLWSMALITVGARVALNGKSYAVAVVMVMWVVIVIAAPILTGVIKLEESDDAQVESIQGDNFPGEMPMDGGMPLDGGMIDPMMGGEMPVESGAGAPVMENEIPIEGEQVPLEGEMLPLDERPLEAPGEEVRPQELPAVEVTTEPGE